MGLQVKRLGRGLLVAAAAGIVCSFGLAEAGKPRLLVVVSVDQLCYWYLNEFRDGFAEDGMFRRVEAEGAHFTNCHHRHAFTFTGPGHSVLLSGAYPNQTGIIGNEWFDPQTSSTVYCVDCAESPLVGDEGKGVSPLLLTAETVGDVLKQATEGKARVFGVSLKDRAGVLMAGRKADASYWFSGGKWITSRYYLDALPGYVRVLNESGALKSYAGKQWRLLLPPSKYRHFRPDDFKFESDANGLGRAFPHPLAEANDARYFKQLPVTPYGNELALQMARLLITEEKLGSDDVPDLLAIGLSSNDYIGHAYGPYSLEVQDVTFRTDRALGELGRFLDEQVGRRGWLMAVTADHGVAPIPEFVSTLGLARKRDPLRDLRQLKAQLESRLRDRIGPPATDASYVGRVEASQIYLTRDANILPPAKAKLARTILRDAIAGHPSVVAAVTSDELNSISDPADPLLGQFKKSFHPQRSGDVLFVLRPYEIQSSAPTTHGSPWPYDTHVPLLLWGAGIQPGQYDEPASPAQIAPTLAAVLGVRKPEHCAVEAPKGLALSVNAKP